MYDVSLASTKNSYGLFMISSLVFEFLSLQMEGKSVEILLQYKECYTYICSVILCF